MIRRCHADHPAEVVTQQRGVPKPGRSAILRCRSRFPPAPPSRIEHPLVDDYCIGAASIDEPAGEGARRHADPAGQHRHREQLVEVAQHPVGAAQSLSRTHRTGISWSMYCCLPVALQGHHHPARSALSTTSRPARGAPGAGRRRCPRGTGTGIRCRRRRTAHCGLGLGGRIRRAGRRRASSGWCAAGPSSSSAAPATTHRPPSGSIDPEVCCLPHRHRGTPARCPPTGFYRMGITTRSAPTGLEARNPGEGGAG